MPVRMLCLLFARQVRVRLICLLVVPTIYGVTSMAALEGVEVSSSSSLIRPAAAEVSLHGYEATEGQGPPNGPRPVQV